MTTIEQAASPEATTAAAMPEPAAPASASLATVEPAVSAPPPGLPAELWDEAAGMVRSAELLNSFIALQEQLGRSLPLPSGPEDTAARQRLLAALGCPERPEDYRLETTHPLLASDLSVNARLHQAGLTQDQAQLVYNLAGEVLLPIVSEMTAELRAQRDLERLHAEFGGAQNFARLAEQLGIWGRANLDGDTFATLSASAEGVLAMHQIMKSREPMLVGVGGDGLQVLDETALTTMVRDPRYWRDRDPDFVARVTRGFEQLYR